jgi:hypothetical protein
MDLVIVLLNEESAAALWLSTEGPELKHRASLPSVTGSAARPCYLIGMHEIPVSLIFHISFLPGRMWYKDLRSWARQILGEKESAETTTANEIKSPSNRLDRDRSLKQPMLVTGTILHIESKLYLTVHAHAGGPPPLHIVLIVSMFGRPPALLTKHCRAGWSEIVN